ncbi:hypothetical protein, partial [Nocardioides kribbensis]|uniref:hypothetical protein n=1 Tax=Nocardioides kribbensis TaxID=305517 RepID=UPI0032DA8456
MSTPAPDDRAAAVAASSGTGGPADDGRSAEPTEPTDTLPPEMTRVLADYERHLAVERDLSP